MEKVTVPESGAVHRHQTVRPGRGSAFSSVAFALLPDEFAAMVRAVRNTEAVLGKVDYTFNAENRKFGRSLYAVKDIKVGEKFTAENVHSIRPANGLHPRMYDKIIGRRSRRDIAFGAPLTLDDVEYQNDSMHVKNGSIVNTAHSLTTQTGSGTY